jgi:hypothetical protein
MFGPRCLTVFLLVGLSIARQKPQLTLDLDSHGISKQRRLLLLPICHRHEATGKLLHSHDDNDEDDDHLWHETTLVESTYSTKWSHRPRCIQKSNTTQIYCIYTSASFARNRGISFFTTPEHAAALLTLPALNNPSLHHDTDIYINTPYEAVELPGRGIGLVANKTLQRGDLLIHSTPVLVVEEDIFTEVPNALRYAMQGEAVARLPPATQELYMSLCAHFGGDKIEDIINTNAFAVSPFAWEAETSFTAVLPEISV